tara:strand:- start:1952 stop:2554 length:603 start_codon:yes stop_codon:yes gene_type:complete
MKMNIRKSLGKGLGAVAIGLALASGSSLADEVKDRYEGLNHFTAFSEVEKRAVSLEYEDWEEEVLDYDGAVMVLFNSSCNETGRAEMIDRNMEVVYLKLMDKFEKEKVNDLPLKFAMYDVCGDRESLEFHSGGIQTHMYLNGGRIGWQVGGPTNEEGITNNTQRLSAWIESNALGKPYMKNGQPMKVKIEGEYDSELVPF